MPMSSRMRIRKGLVLDDALVRIAQEDPNVAGVAKLRLFAGLSECASGSGQIRFAWERWCGKMSFASEGQRNALLNCRRRLDGSDALGGLSRDSSLAASGWKMPRCTERGAYPLWPEGLSERDANPSN
jgi:hypothetical protein